MIQEEVEDSVPPVQVEDSVPPVQVSSLSVSWLPATWGGGNWENSMKMQINVQCMSSGCTQHVLSPIRNLPCLTPRLQNNRQF